ncbi:hypothetical protein IWQ61_008788 [Dispira simplex]|nr:hypothetical protein IWQ61_008788 [Dispira simplex]
MSKAEVSVPAPDHAGKSCVFFAPTAVPIRPMRREWYLPASDNDREHITIKHPRQVNTQSLRDILRNNFQRRQSHERDGTLEELDTTAPAPNYLEESNQIATVRKERVFECEVTETEMDIIQQRVALQQRQFAEFEKRDFNRKARKIRSMFDYLCDEEIKFALEKFRNNEEEVIGQFSCPGYLYSVRKELASVNVQPVQTSTMSDEQRAAYEQLLRKRNATLKKSTTDDVRRKYRNCKRLTLDDALKQLQQNKVDPAKAMEGWSVARIKAYQAIDTKPNTYYYRFNAPGEEQRTGAWTEEEKVLFHQRLAEIGANGQWGIFSMAIPGRVGYQCSNYYRYLIETRQIHDPNYVLDDKGKAHYLFTTKKKNSDGTAVKTFRKHKKKHTFTNYGEEEGSSAAENPDIPLPLASTGGGGGGVGSDVPGTPSRKRTVTSTATVRKRTRRNPETQADATTKRKRRGYSHYDSDDDDEDTLAYQDDSSDEDFAVSSRTAWNTTRRTRGRGQRDTTPTTFGPNLGSEATSDTTDAQAGSTNANDTTNFMTLMANGLQGLNSSELADLMEDDEDMFYDPTNPLSGFTDPITLDPVVKPAISPYGHVMGYDTWVRCLTSEGKRNICPLTKKPLSKRDLVVLTFENIEEYRDKIVNL